MNRVNFEDGSIYMGEIKDGKPNGKGFLKYPEDAEWGYNGVEYLSEFKDGKYDGDGIISDGH